METPAPGGVGLSTFFPEPPRAIPTEALARMLEDVDEACGRTISEVAASSLPFSCSENSRGSVVALVKVSVTRFENIARLERSRAGCSVLFQ